MTRRRHNPRSAYDTPPGFFLCPHPTCRLLLPDRYLEQPWFRCGRGHEYAPGELERLAYEPGGWTHAGIPCTEQGELAERIARDHHDYGPYGRVAEWASTYHAPLDGVTTRKWGVEVKSVSTRARNLAFCPGPPPVKRRKDEHARERGLRGILGVLVIIDYPTSTAELHVRAMERIHYFERGAPFATVRFTNPFVDARAAA